MHLQVVDGTVVMGGRVADTAAHGAHKIVDAGKNITNDLVGGTEMVGVVRGGVVYPRWHKPGSSQASMHSSPSSPVPSPPPPR